MNISDIKLKKVVKKFPLGTSNMDVLFGRIPNAKGLYVGFYGAPLFFIFCLFVIKKMIINQIIFLLVIIVVMIFEWLLLNKAYETEKTDPNRLIYKQIRFIKKELVFDPSTNDLNEIENELKEYKLNTPFSQQTFVLLVWTIGIQFFLTVVFPIFDPTKRFNDESLAEYNYHHYPWIFLLVVTIGIFIGVRYFFFFINKIDFDSTKFMVIRQVKILEKTFFNRKKEEQTEILELIRKKYKFKEIKSRLALYEPTEDDIQSANNNFKNLLSENNPKKKKKKKKQTNK